MEHAQAKRNRERTQEEERLKQNGGFGETHGVGDLLGLAVELVQDLQELRCTARLAVWYTRRASGKAGGRTSQVL